jgi:uncharacterized protein YukE
MTEQLNNLNQIRDLLFGEQLNQYDDNFNRHLQRLEELETLLSSFQGQIQMQLKQLENDMAEQLDSLRQSLEGKLKQYGGASATEFNKLNQFLGSDTGSFNTELSSFQKDFTQKYGAVKTDLMAMRSQLETQLESLRGEAAQEWRKKFTHTNDGELAKEQLGKMLFEFSLKTRDGNFLAELPEASQAQIRAELEA